MKDYEEFKNLRKEKDKNNPFCALYYLESGESFVVYYYDRRNISSGDGQKATPAY